MKFGGIARSRGGNINIRKLRRSLRPTRKKIKKILLYGIGGFLVFVALLFIWFAKDLPTPAKLAKLRAVESTKIYDRNGVLLYQTGEQKRTVIEKGEIPQNIKDAVISAEDANFYRHHGLDFKGIARAALSDILKLKKTQGGSTITQQFVKNALLTREKTFTRKIKEVILSIEIEQLYSKDDILAMYLNEIPFGGNIYGVEEASKTFFGKQAKDLTLSEAATLAAIPRAPTHYSPYGTHTDKLFGRKDYVLNRMSRLGYITKEEAEVAKEEAPSKEKPEFKQRRESILAPHFVMYVKERLVEMYGESLVNSGGLKVTTTLDLEKQNKAQEAIVKNEPKLDRYKATNAALVSLDGRSGEILAMVGGKDYFDLERGGNVNVTDALRQPGSSFKPIVYAAAFKNPRFSPAFTLFDLSTEFGDYRPRNYDGSTRGPVSMRFALANSLNIPAVKALALVGMSDALKTAKELGITTLNQPQRYGLSLVLGGGEVKPIEMAGAFAAFANSGIYHKPTAVLKVEDSHSKTLYQYRKEANSFRALDPQIAYQIAHILDDDAARRSVFGANNALDFGEHQVLAKTGTTQNFHDAWTVGATAKIATAVWVGNNDNAKMAAGADGSIVAAPIFHDYTRNFLDGAEFARPDGLEEITVEKYSGRLPSQHSREFVTDIFATWQIPTERDNVNRTVEVNKINGKKAADQTPRELIEERRFFAYYNEWGERWRDYPGWTAPIRGWIQSQGFYLAPPQEDDDSYSSLPKITITSPANEATVKGKVTVSVSHSSEYQVAEVVYFLGDAQVASASGAPFGASFESSKYQNGAHKLTARLKDVNGVKAEHSTKINIQNAPAPKISGITVSGITANSATVSFSTDSAADSAVHWGLASGSYDKSSPAGSKATSHSATLAGLSSGKKYFVRITAKNADGIESSSETSFTTL